MVDEQREREREKVHVVRAIQNIATEVQKTITENSIAKCFLHTHKCTLDVRQMKCIFIIASVCNARSARCFSPCFCVCCMFHFRLLFLLLVVVMVMLECLDDGIESEENGGGRTAFGGEMHVCGKMF